ncbi:MAG TPA: TonB-dependent receptor [Casimicrobiaceae bacterium]
MNFQRKKVATALAYMLGASGTMSLSAAYAQTSSPDIRVEVTGTNIRRVEGEGALPVQVITREEINKTGAQNAYDLLQLISVNASSGGTSFGNVIGATTFSAQTASLRGLGGQATLVLINGKRVTPFSGEVQGVYGVNLDMIPFQAIERVEVLKDGASAIYGSDAVGGVINFILRQDYQGAEATAYYGTPTRSGGGDVWNIKATAGWGDLSKDRWNAFLSAYYQEAKPLDQKDRDFSRTAYIPSEGYNTTSGNTFPGYVNTGGIGSLEFPNCEAAAPGNIVVGSRCRFDPARVPGVESIPDTKTTSIFGSGRFQFTPDWQGYAWGFYTKEENRFIIQPTPISEQFFYGPNGDIPATILLPPTSPYYPHAQAAAHGVDGQPLSILYRCFVCGLRDQTDTNEGWQGVAGTKGSAWNWDFDFDFFYSENQTKERPNGGFVRYSQILPILSSGVVNLFGQNPQAVDDLVNSTQYHADAIQATSKNYGIEAKASGDIYRLPAGPLSMAFGAMARKEELSQKFDEALRTGDITGYGGNFPDIDKSRRNEAAYVEFNIPIVKNLEGDAAVRYDHYSDFGNTTNPKLSLRWNPVQQLLLRASWGTGFIAPTLTQLYGANQTGVSSPGLDDPIRCPVTGSTFDCATQFPVTFGGNPNLKPEKANQWQVGFVLEPVRGFSVGVDYFDIDLKNLFVNGIPQQTILSDLATYGNLITRAAPDPQFPNLPGRIINMDQRFINIGENRLKGFDLDLRARLPQTSWGRVSLGLQGTYYQTNDVQQQDGSFAGFVANAYQAVATGITPRWKHYATATWDYGPWTATLAQSFQTSYIDNQTNADDELRRVGSLSLWDLQASYTGFKNWNLTVGVKNLFDTNPPFTNQLNTFQAGYDPSYYDARARFVYASIGYTWKP